MSLWRNMALCVGADEGGCACSCRKPIIYKMNDGKFIVADKL